LPELGSAAYASAQLTGAFGSMDYGEVSDYATIYGFQSNVQELQRSLVKQVTIVLSRTWLIDEPKPSPQEVEFWRRDIDVLRSEIFFLKQFTEQLRDAYAKVLARVDQR
jgi:hypothetical protein